MVATLLHGLSNASHRLGATVSHTTADTLISVVSVVEFAIHVFVTMLS